jgi:hypothetical protein
LNDSSYKQQEFEKKWWILLLLNKIFVKSKISLWFYQKNCT